MGEQKIMETIETDKYDGQDRYEGQDVMDDNLQYVYCNAFHATDAELEMEGGRCTKIQRKKKSFGL